MSKQKRLPIPEEQIDTTPDAARLERVTLTCSYFQHGYPPAAIKDALYRNHKIIVSRETPYQDLLYAARSGYLNYKAPYVQGITEKLNKLLGETKIDISVIQTQSRQDVASAAADLVRDLVQEIALKKRVPRLDLKSLASKPEKPVRVPVHLGFSGGRTVSVLADRLGLLLTRDLDELDELVQREVLHECKKQGLMPSLPEGFIHRFSIQFVFHNLVTGFEYNNPSTHPIAFLFKMVAGTRLAEASRSVFICFNAPPFASLDPKEFGRQFDLPVVHEAKEDSKELDVLVTSAGSFEDEGALLRCFYSPPYMDSKHSKQALKFFEQCKCRGDFLWQPMTDKGPLRLSPENPEIPVEDLRYRPVTLVDIETLPQRIQDGTKVVLALGPSQDQGGNLLNKADILQAILRQSPQFLTHAIVDVETARRTADWLGSDKG